MEDHGARAQVVPQALERGRGVGRADLAAAVVAGVGGVGQVADHGELPHLRLVERQQAAVVLQQHHALLRHLAGEGRVLGRAGQAARVGLRVLAGQVDELGADDAPHALVDLGPGDLALLHQLLQVAAVDLAHRHLDVEPRVHAALAVVDAPHPVRGHEAAEAPLLAQDRRQQVAALAAPLAAHLVVGAHERGDVVLDGLAEVRQVDLVQRALVDQDAVLEARGLHAVEREVLRAGHDVVALHRLEDGDAHLAREPGVLAVDLLGPSHRGVAHEVEAEPAPVVRALRARLLADRVADPALQVEVPARGTRHGDRERGRAAAGDAARPVAERDRRDAQPLVAARVDRGHLAVAEEQRDDHRPEAGAGHLLDFLVERHPRDELARRLVRRLVRHRLRPPRPRRRDVLRLQLTVGPEGREADDDRDQGGDGDERDPDGFPEALHGWSLPVSGPGGRSLGPSARPTLVEASCTLLKPSSRTVRRQRNRTTKAWLLPSLRFSSNLRQVPAYALAVFQT